MISVKINKYLIWIILLIISLFLDNLILQYFQNIRISEFNSIITKFSIFTNGFFSLIFIGLIILIYNRKLILRFLLGFGVTALITYIIKIAIRRPRPFSTLDIISLIPSETGFSFPSGHAVFAFFSLAFIWNKFPKFRWIWLILSILIALSRIYTGVHYLSDIIAAIIIGLSLGKLFSKSAIFKKLNFFK